MEPNSFKPKSEKEIVEEIKASYNWYAKEAQRLLVVLKRLGVSVENLVRISTFPAELNSAANDGNEKTQSFEQYVVAELQAGYPKRMAELFEGFNKLTGKTIDRKSAASMLSQNETIRAFELLGYGQENRWWWGLKEWAIDESENSKKLRDEYKELIIKEIDPG